MCFTTHRVAQAQSADRIIVLAHGRIVEEGSHTELLRMGGAYAQLVRAGGVSEEEAGAVVDLAAGLTAEAPPTAPMSPAATGVAAAVAVHE